MRLHDPTQPHRTAHLAAAVLRTCSTHLTLSISVRLGRCPQEEDDQASPAPAALHNPRCAPFPSAREFGFPARQAMMLFLRSNSHTGISSTLQHQPITARPVIR